MACLYGVPPEHPQVWPMIRERQAALQAARERGAVVVRDPPSDAKN